ncbi:phage major tail tube protein [Bartonella sp. B17]
MALLSTPRILTNFNLYLDGGSYGGRCDSVTLPNLTATVESHRAAGMNGSIDIATGIEALTMQMVISDFDPKLITLFNNDDCAITLRGAVKAQGKEKEEGVIINARGLYKGLEFSQWQGGSKTTQTVSASLTYYRYRQNDVDYAEIDLLNMVQKIGGVDQLAEQRRILGL